MNMYYKMMSHVSRFKDILSKCALISDGDILANDAGS